MCVCVFLSPVVDPSFAYVFFFIDVSRIPCPRKPTDSSQYFQESSLMLPIVRATNSLASLLTNYYIVFSIVLIPRNLKVATYCSNAWGGYCST